ncbi:MAG: ribosomal-processing cysteine protease Prp [Bacilli bacterium]|jgi:uncharacterized protein YsxB (DUF464 family)
MIKVNIISNGDIINEIKIVGHANYDEHGKDIICASVSSIVITTVNGILSIYANALKYIQSDDQLLIRVLESNEIVNKLLNNMINLLKELEVDYVQHIKIID